MPKGSCLCGAVAYEIDALASPVVCCHCTTCRKAHASAFNVGARVRLDQFRWIRGEEVVAAFESSPGKQRFFCPRCGSQLVALRAGEGSWVLRVASLDEDPGARPGMHIWMEDACPWATPAEGLPAHDRYPPAP
ncbi:MAG: GFA family protein [Pseudomonadales bacterium]|jgi:ADP-ribosyl-[dinitrogen reductase] hydrolase|nr:GFA family protein [Pseudomonadales bacterium]